MEKSVNIVFLWKCLKKCWVFMVIAAIVAALVVGSFIYFFTPKKFSCSVDFYIINTNTSYDYTTQSLLSASEYLIRDYVKLIKSDTFLKSVAEEVNKGRDQDKQVDPKQLRSMITSSSEAETSVFTIKVTHTDEALVQNVAEQIKNLAPEKVTELAKPVRLTNEYLVNMVWETMVAIEYENGRAENPSFSKEQAINVVSSKCSKDHIRLLLKNEGLDSSLDCFIAVNDPGKPTLVSRNIVKLAFVGAVLAAALVYFCFAARGFFRANLVSEEDIKQFINRPIIGTIPHWENGSKSSKK